MKKKIITIFIVALVLASGAAIISCGGSSGTTGVSTTEKSSPGQTEEAMPEEPSSGQAATMLHSTQGRENCLMCHDEGKTKPFPSDHAGRQNDSCLTCHKS